MRNNMCIIYLPPVIKISLIEQDPYILYAADLFTLYNFELNSASLVKIQLLTSVLSAPPNGGSLVPLRENRARAFCGINVYMSFFVYINRPVSIIYVHHYAASLSECRYLGCVFCNLMYRCTEDRTKVPCGIMDVLYNDHGSYIYY